MRFGNIAHRLIIGQSAFSLYFIRYLFDLSKHCCTQLGLRYLLYFTYLLRNMMMIVRMSNMLVLSNSAPSQYLTICRTADERIGPLLEQATEEAYADPYFDMA